MTTRYKMEFMPTAGTWFLCDTQKTENGGRMETFEICDRLNELTTPPQAQAQAVERNHEEDDWRITQAIRADKQGRSWHVGERESGSISVFYTRMEVSGHYVVYDTSESHPLAAPQQQTDGYVVAALIAALKDRPTFGGTPTTAFGREYREWEQNVDAMLLELDGPK